MINGLYSLYEYPQEKNKCFMFPYCVKFRSIRMRFSFFLLCLDAFRVSRNIKVGLLLFAPHDIKVEEITK